MTSAGVWSKARNAFDGLAQDTLWSATHDLLQLVTSLTSFILLSSVLPLATYGAYVGLYGLLGTFGALSYSGIGLAALQRLIGEGDDSNRSLRSFLTLGVMLGGLVALVATMAGGLTLSLALVEIAALAVVELVAVAVILLSTNLIQAASGFAAATKVQIPVPVFRLGVVTGLYSVGQLSIANLVAGLLATMGAYAVVVLLVILPRHGFVVELGRPGSTALKSSAMFAIPMGASRLQTDGDKWLLNAFGFEAQAGLYGAAYRVIMLGTLPLLALDRAAFQRFLPRDEGQPGVHWQRATRMGLLMVGSSIVVALIMWAALPLIINLILHDEQYKPAAAIVPWLLPLIPLIATSNSPMNGLLGLGRVQQRMSIYLAAAVVSVSLYLILIPRMGWRGAAVATFISEVFLSTLSWSALWLYQRRADDAHARLQPSRSITDEFQLLPDVS